MKILKKIALCIACFSMLNLAYAGGPDLWQGKGRIAVSSDGNMHDNDDMQATMMTLMILAKAGLQANTTLYTYADHVWGSENNDLAIMRESAEGGGQRFGFQDTNFMAAVSDPEAAYNAMRDEILKSTVNDPLFIIAAGPMQVVGEGINRAYATNSDALNHVTVISHSLWNDRHADNPAKSGSVHGGEPTHSGWTWAEMESSFGSKVNFNHISDQNGTTDQPYKTKDKFSAPAWSSWHWMRDHQDPNIKWVYTKGVANPGGPDYSDAGMAYYLVADLNGQRGDEFGNPEKLRQWVGTDVIPVVIDPTKVSGVSLNTSFYHIKTINNTYQLTAAVTPSTAVNKNVTWSSSDETVATVDANGLVTGLKLGTAQITVTTEEKGKTAFAAIQVGEVPAGEVKVGDNYISFEAESTKSSLGKWVIRRPGDPDLIQGTSCVSPVNNTYLEYTGNNPAGGPSGRDILVYKFTPQTAGTYTLTGRMAQNQNGEPWDRANDIYVKLAGDFEPGANSATKEEMLKWTKFYGRGLEDWGAFVKGEPHHGTRKTYRYVLKAGEEYIFSISGRSQRVCIDYFLFVKQAPGIIITEKKDLATHSPEYMRPGTATETDGCGGDTGDGGNDDGNNEGCSVINAHDFTNTNVAGYDAATKNTIPNSPANGINRGENVIGCAGANGLTRPIAAEVTYNGEDDDVNFIIKAVGEPDGECTYGLYINGTKLGEKQASRIFGTSTLPYTYEELEINETPYALKKGDVIRVTSNQVTNELVPEGEHYATARGRWVSLEICGEGQSSGGNDGGTGGAESVAIANFPSSIPLSQLSIPVTVNYSANESRDINAAITKVGGGFVKNNKVTVNAGSGSTTITVALTTPLEEGQGYIMTVALRPVGGNWQTTLTDDAETFTGGSGGNDGGNTVEEEAISLVNVPASFDSGLMELPFTVNYSASESRDINVAITKMDGSFVQNNKTTVVGGTGEITITVNLLEELTADEEYRVTAALRPIGGNWQTDIQKDDTTFRQANLSVANLGDNILDYVNAYPNPFTDEFIIEAEGTISFQEVELLDLNAKVLYSRYVENESTVDLSNVIEVLAPGLYFVRITATDGTTGVFKALKN